MTKAIRSLTLRKEYWFDQIEAFASKNGLMEKVDGYLEPFGDGDLSGEIGEVVMPLYFDSGEVAANFILTGCATQTVWRCIYVCQTFSSSGEHAI